MIGSAFELCLRKVWVRPGSGGDTGRESSHGEAFNSLPLPRGWLLLLGVTRSSYLHNLRPKFHVMRRETLPFTAPVSVKIGG